MSGLQICSCAHSMSCNLSPPLLLEFRQVSPTSWVWQTKVEVAGMSCTVHALSWGDEACRYPCDALTESSKAGPLWQPFSFTLLRLVLKRDPECTRLKIWQSQRKNNPYIQSACLQCVYTPQSIWTGRKLNKEVRAFLFTRLANLFFINH